MARKTASTKTKKTNKYEIPNLKKAFEALEQISSVHGGLTFPQLLERISCNKTSFFRILLTLEGIGYIRKNPETDAYTVSRKILPLAYSSLCDANLIEESVHTMRELRDLTGETVMLGAFIDSECVMICQETGTHPFNFTGTLGMTSPMHASAPGKALLSAIDEAEADKILSESELKKCASNTITSAKILKPKLSEYAQKGYAYDESEAVDGVNCVASAIYDAHKTPVAVIWITGPSSRIKAEDFESLGKSVKEAALSISRRMGLNK